MLTNAWNWLKVQNLDHLNFFVMGVTFSYRFLQRLFLNLDYVLNYFHPRCLFFFVQNVAKHFNHLFSTGDMTALHCLDKHPTQPHIVCTGGQDGALTVWDMRQDKFPVTVLQAHSADSKCIWYSVQTQRLIISSKVN